EEFLYRVAHQPAGGGNDDFIGFCGSSRQQQCQRTRQGHHMLLSSHLDLLLLFSTVRSDQPASAGTALDLAIFRSRPTASRMKIEMPVRSTAMAGITGVRFCSISSNIIRGRVLSRIPARKNEITG